MHVLSSILAIAIAGGIALLSAGLYLLPVLIGAIRRVPDIGSVAVVNILLGWTLVGWAAALAMALRSARPPATAVQIVQNLPAPRAAAEPDDRCWAGRTDLRPQRDGSPPPLDLPARPTGPGAAG